MTSTTTRATGTPDGVVLVRKAVAQAYPEQKSTRVDISSRSHPRIIGDNHQGKIQQKRIVRIVV
jgi:ribosomal protein L31